MTERWFTVLCIPGTSEKTTAGRVTGMLSTVTAGLHSRFHCEMVPYPAAYGHPMAEARSIQIGVENVLSAARRAPSPVVLLGYSQGAQVARLVLSEVSSGMHPDIAIAGAGLLADPWRPPAVIDGPDELRAQIVGWGAAGVGPDWPDHIPVWEIAMPRDVITDAPGDSPIRIIADWTEWMSVTDAYAWGRNIELKIRTNRWQAVKTNWLNPFAVLDQYGRAFKDIQAYLSGYHMQYGVRTVPGSRFTYSEYLRELINKNVR